jgi:hypothetical protein
MSHIVQIQTQVRDFAALGAACRRLQLPEPLHGTAALYSGTVTGWQVRLPGWRYPLVADLTTGQLHYDNYGGRWGPEPELHRFLQAYAVERTRLELLRQGRQATERVLEDGSIQLTVQLRGAS